MAILILWQWWYRRGWQSAAAALLDTIRTTFLSFSVSVLLKTLFAPWKRTVNIAGPNTPLALRVHWWVGNQVSRFIGFFIRVFVLMVSLSVLAAMAVGSLVLLVIWPVAPLAVIAGLIMAVVSVWA